jgi:hypothetical protein
MRDLAMVVSSPTTEAMAASYDKRNLQGSVFLWYLGGDVAR